MFVTERIPLKLTVQDAKTDNLRERYGGVSGASILEAEIIKPVGDTRLDFIGIFMHPTSIMTTLPLPVALARRGMHICVATSRYPNNDTLLIAENVVQDLGHFIKHLRQRLGYIRIGLFGWSGGGALAAMYQSQSERATIKTTPTGVPVNFSQLISADILVLVAAHCGRAAFLTESLDPSIYFLQRDPSNPKESALRSLQIYAPWAPVPPYSKEFLQEYRAAQKARADRITNYARSVAPDTPMIIQGTMADPRWLDLSIDPNDRKFAGKCFLGDCEPANDMPTGLARFTTAASWLSQWADGVSEFDALKHLPNISIPTLVISNGADDGVPASHGQLQFQAITHSQKEFLLIPNATHYYIEPGTPPTVNKTHLLAAVGAIAKFVDKFSQISLPDFQTRFGETHWPPTSVSETHSDDNLPPAPRALGFSHVAMVCKDMATTIRFYSGILGFKVVKTLQLHDGGQHFFLNCGDVSGGTLAFFWWPELPARASGIASASRAEMEKGMIPRSAPGSVNHIAYQYPEEGLHAMRARLKKAGVWVSPLVYHAENDIGVAFSRDDPAVIVISMYFWGPDGELIELACATSTMFPPKVSDRILHAPASLPVCKL